MFINFLFFCLGADTRRDERRSAPSVRRGQHFCFVPAELLIDEIRIYSESGLLILVFYHFGPLLSMKLDKIVDSVSYFPCNSMKYEFGLSLDFWQILSWISTQKELATIIDPNRVYFRKISSCSGSTHSTRIKDPCIAGSEP
jgi:hypothetical protein